MSTALAIDRLQHDQVDAVIEVLGLARLNQGDGTYLVAWMDGNPVGHVYVTHATTPEIQDLEVRREHRKQGIGSALVAAAEQFAESRQATQITLEVSAEDESTQRLYAELGYVVSFQKPRRVEGFVMIRTGPLAVNDLLVRMNKALGRQG